MAMFIYQNQYGSFSGFNLLYVVSFEGNDPFDKERPIRVTLRDNVSILLNKKDSESFLKIIAEIT